MLFFYNKKSWTLDLGKPFCRRVFYESTNDIFVDVVLSDAPARVVVPVSVTRNIGTPLLMGFFLDRFDTKAKWGVADSLVKPQVMPFFSYFPAIGQRT